MKVIGPLTWEHRLIERMVALMRTELQAIREGSINSKFIDTTLDFFRTYAERLPFRKEEDILFASLGRKKLSAELVQIMAELIEEHAKLKEYVDVIVNVHNDTDEGGSESLRGMIKPIEEMPKLYPSHTEKEDKHFFYPLSGIPQPTRTGRNAESLSGVRLGVDPPAVPGHRGSPRKHFALYN